MLTFQTREVPRLASLGARYVVIAVCGDWRDGDITNYRHRIPHLQRELRKRFMTRFDRRA